MNLSASRILIAGVGNVLFGDDAFGSEVARRLAEQSLPDCVRVIDFGIRGFDLAMALLEPYDVVIIVDSLNQSERPGALHVLDSRRDLTISFVATQPPTGVALDRPRHRSGTGPWPSWPAWPRDRRRL